jgi:uncharacterized membrane protein YphA (DoxX/SURF4 family)
MKSDPSLPAGTVAETITVLGRWTLGAVFIYTGWHKALAPVDFLKLLREYDLPQVPWVLNSIAGVLPWFEMFCGVLLLGGVAVRGTALMLELLLVSFTWLVLRRAWVLSSTLDLPFCAVKFDCGCGTGTVWVCRKLAENVLLMLLAGGLLTGRGRRFSLRFRLINANH